MILTCSHLGFLAGAPELDVLGAPLGDLRAAALRLRGGAAAALVALQVPRLVRLGPVGQAAAAAEEGDRVGAGERPHRAGRVRRAGEHPRRVAALDGAVRRVRGRRSAGPPAQPLPRRPQRRRPWQRGPAVKQR